MKTATYKHWESKIPELVDRIQNPVTPSDIWDVYDELMRMARLADAKRADMTAILYSENINENQTTKTTRSTRPNRIHNP